MQTIKQHKELGQEKLQRIIEMCIAIENHSIDPFSLNVDDIIKIVKEYFPDWKHPDELRLDAEALHHLASVIKMQSEWVKHRSTLLYTDPFLLEQKIQQMSKEQMVEVFVQAWTPLVEAEQITLNAIAQSLLYWEALAPIDQRWKEVEAAVVPMGNASRDELIKQRVLSNIEFSQELDGYWQELKDCVAKNGQEGKIRYWDFIGVDTYEGTVQRAFLASFLVTYGYATLEIDRLEELVFLKPYAEQRTELLTQQSNSVPIAVSFEEWQKWKRGELD